MSAVADGAGDLEAVVRGSCGRPEASPEETLDAPDFGDKAELRRTVKHLDSN